MSRTGGYLGQVKETVIQWLRRHNYPLDRRKNPVIGRKARDLAYKGSGLIPLKDNAPKTKGTGGNHTMLYHDPVFLDRELTPYAQEYYGKADNQMELFPEFRPGVDVPLKFEGNGNGDGDLRPGVELDCPLCHAPLIFPRDEGPCCLECGWPTK